VIISVRDAIIGKDLSKLREAVDKEFLTLDESERRIHSVMAKLESGLVRRLAEFHNA
jgi:F-type H+-transporting ATPase subunit epsilon